MPLNSTLLMTGSSISRGKSPRIRDTAERTSSSAACESRSRRNSADTTAVPSLTWLYRCFRPCALASAFSILRATSASIWSGEAPGMDAVTVIIGRSMSGNSWIFMALNAMKPRNVSIANPITAGIGLRMDQADMFMINLSPLARHRLRSGTARRVSTTGSFALSPCLTSMRSPLRCPIFTGRSCTWLSGPTTSTYVVLPRRITADCGNDSKLRLPPLTSNMPRA